MPDIAKVRELNAELDKLVPLPGADASPFPGGALVRHYAAECLVHSARFSLSMKRARQWGGIADVDLIEPVTASFAAATFLAALYRADPETAGKVAASVLDVCEMGETSEMACDHLGADAERVAALAEQIAAAMAEPDEIAKARDAQRRRDVDAWRAAGGTP
jgi:hypothetical protein